MVANWLKINKQGCTDFKIKAIKIKRLYGWQPTANIKILYCENKISIVIYNISVTKWTPKIQSALLYC